MEPMEGVRVLELAGWMAGPGATAMMADLGAEVIKVEPLHGDAMRGATRQPEVAAGAPAIADFAGRKAHMSELTDEMDALFAERTLAGWGRLFDANDFIWGPASTVAEFASDPQAEALGLFPTIDHPAGRLRTIGSPVSVAGADVRPRGPAPAIGEHTAQVLAELGVSTEQLRTLTDEGIVSTG